MVLADSSNDERRSAFGDVGVMEQCARLLKSSESPSVVFYCLNALVNFSVSPRFGQRVCRCALHSAFMYFMEPELAPFHIAAAKLLSNLKHHQVKTSCVKHEVQSCAYIASASSAAG